MGKVKEEIFKTKSVDQALKNYAAENFTPLSECDFEINKIDTYTKDNADDEFKILNVDINEFYKNKKELINTHTLFEQLFSITAKVSTSCDIKLNYTIEYGRYSTHPKIIINHDSHIPYKNFKPKDLFTLLLNELNKIKARNGILVNIFDETMIKNLKAFTKYIYAGKFIKRVRIPLFEGVEPLLSRESRLILCFEDAQNNNQVIEVNEGDVLVEFIKPIFGSNGFNAFGKIIDCGFAINDEDLQAKIDNESIKIIEKESRKTYISKIKGYVHYDKKSLKIDNKVHISNISRNQEMLASDEENNIEVTISQNDTTKDSIGEGVELISETIHVHGHVGANSIIEAINLQIDGATHKDSTQFAKFAKLNRHKGSLRCHEAQIALLEGGEVHATKVNVEAALGGTIYAQDVIIGHVKSNLKVYASNSISIRLVSGEDNIFKINYKDVPVLISKIDLIQDDIEDLKFNLEEAQRHNISEVPNIIKKIQEYKEEQNLIKDSVYSAQITIEKPLIGLNKIIFTIDEINELVYKTDARSYKPFYLNVQEEKIILAPTTYSISKE